MDIACQRKVAITIDHTNLTGSVSGFDVLLNRANLPDEMCSPTDSNAAQADGGDIRFSSDALGETQLACDIISFEHDSADAAGDAAVQIRVNVPTISSSVDTTIYAWYSTSGTDSQPGVSDTYGRSATYDSDTLAYYAMHEDPSGSAPQMIDRTGNGYDGTSNGSMTDTDVVAGQVGDALEFDGSNDYINCGTDSAMNANAQPTISAWVNLSATSGEKDVVTKWQDNGVGDYQFVFHITNGNVGIFTNGFAGSFESFSGSTTLGTGSWHHVAYVNRDGANSKIYVDGSLDGQATGYAHNNKPSVVQIGCGGNTIGGGNFYGGIIDEVRIESTARSAGWIAARYANESSPETFATVGNPQPAVASASRGPALLIAMGII